MSESINNAGALPKSRVLVVDDVSKNLQVVGAMLRNESVVGAVCLHGFYRSDECCLLGGCQAGLIFSDSHVIPPPPCSR